ncbi:hypothetical protein H5410_008888 [Solanum commersonii]|uniref:Uncharacterized protein n=1 Tax=Solanum commersonii TaxID=4109 RepID=A0A9J6AG86_SOLCO|nr:hypothetical protein H5410_008888 [Solanum commersonii]
MEVEPDGPLSEESGGDEGEKRVSVSENRFGFMRDNQLSKPLNLIWLVEKSRERKRDPYEAIKDICGGARLRVRAVGGDFGTFPVEIGDHRGSILSHFSICVGDGQVDAVDSGGGPMVGAALITRLEVWRQALESKGLRLSRTKARIFEVQFLMW